jgi:diguanylate cyclase (GGDEF)-like protein
MSHGFQKSSKLANLGFVRRSYYARTVGLALGFLMLAAVLLQKQAVWWIWLGPALYCLVWPYVAWSRAHKSAKPREAERLNLLGDHFAIGIAMVVMDFNLLPCVLAVSLPSMDSMAGGGLRLLWRGLVLQMLGVAVGLAIYGFHWHPQTTTLTILASIPILVVQPFLVGFVALTAVHSVNQKRVQLEHLSQHDGLSGLLNRTHWEKLARGEFARFGRNGQPVVLVLADLDHFKRLNDTYGHAAGDEAIRRFAASLKRVLRETDFCGRYGGEEFGILLPFTTARAAKDVVERLRHDLRVNPMMDGVPVTASFGMVELYSDIHSVEEWLRVVDKMLYQAKHQGRDCVVELKDLSNSNLASLEVLPPRRATA